jgi:transposase, IS5 family
MGFKKMDNSLGFADLALASSLKHNRSLKLMEKLDKSIEWSRIEAILLSHYTVGTSGEGADAYPPMLLFKCMLLQKWFRINSDPELENQINDRLSFKKFLGLSFAKPSPDHSTFSRFRSRLSKNAMDQINSEILRQFECKGLTINEGIAVDARLVKSASRPVSNKKLKELKEKNKSPEGKLDKNANSLKFSRDLESNWTAIDDDPHYGLKEHASVDVNNGFILATIMTPASYHESPYLPYCTIYSLHTDQKLKKVMRIKDTSASAISMIKLNGLDLLPSLKIFTSLNLSHLTGAIDAMFRQFAFNLNRGSKLLDLYRLIGLVRPHSEKMTNQCEIT